MLILRMAIGLYVLNLGYLGEGSFKQLKEFQFVSHTLADTSESDVVVGNRFAKSWLGEIPMPIPENYIAGIDVQQRDFENFSRPSYLLGEYQAKGWWYYYGYAMLVKTPLGTLGLALLCMLVYVFRIGPRIAKRDIMILLAPGAIIFAVASAKCGFSHHSRYVLPCVPFIFIYLSSLATSIPVFIGSFGAICNRPKLVRSISWRRGKCSIIGFVSVCLLGWTITSSLAVYPHSISYFNELAGGPKNGPTHLINSNVDWGQDLLFLEEWISQRQPDEVGPVHLAFYNFYNPFDLEIDHIEPWPFRDEEASNETFVPDGVYAVSVNLLYEFPWPVRDRAGKRYSIDKRPLAYLRTQEPIGWAGYSIRIFSADQVREAYTSPPSEPLWQEAK